MTKKQTEKTQICPSCERKVKPPKVWWWEGPGACSDCVLRAAKEIIAELKIAELKQKDE